MMLRLRLVVTKLSLQRIYTSPPAMENYGGLRLFFARLPALRRSADIHT